MASFNLATSLYPLVEGDRKDRLLDWLDFLFHLGLGDTNPLWEYGRPTYPKNITHFLKNGQPHYAQNQTLINHVGELRCANPSIIGFASLRRLLVNLTDMDTPVPYTCLIPLWRFLSFLPHAERSFKYTLLQRSPLDVLLLDRLSAYPSSLRNVERTSPYVMRELLELLDVMLKTDLGLSQRRLCFTKIQHIAMVLYVSSVAHDLQSYSGLSNEIVPHLKTLIKDMTA